MLIEGIIILIIGIVLFAIRGLLPPRGQTAAEIGGIILVILGIILIVLGALGIALLTMGALPLLHT